MSTAVLSHVIGAINTFWFGASDSPTYGQPRPQWFAKDPQFDAQINQRFARVTDAAALGQLDMMAHSAEGAVALVLALDQFPRNIYRDDARAYAHDEQALAMARAALDRRFDRDVPAVMRTFLYLPFEHSENLADQDRAVALFTALNGAGGKEGLAWALKHREVIARFGRFPHRNAVLGRISTPEEKHFLSLPGASF